MNQDDVKEEKNAQPTPTPAGELTAGGMTLSELREATAKIVAERPCVVLPGQPTYAADEEDRRLEVVLTPEEKNEMGRSVLALLKKKSQDEAALKRLNDHYKGEIKDDTNKITELREVIESGKEMRAVRCLRFKDFARRSLTVIRVDNDIVVENRKLEDGEIPKPKQAELPFANNATATAPENVKEENTAPKAASAPPVFSSLTSTLISVTPPDVHILASSSEVESVLLAAESELVLLQKEHDAQPTAAGARKLIALDMEIIGLRADLREALRAEQEHSDVKKKATTAAAAAKTPTTPTAPTASPKQSAPGDSGNRAFTCRVVGGEVFFKVYGEEKTGTDFPLGPQLLVAYLMRVAGTAKLLLDKLDVKVEPRSVARYAAGERKVPADFIQALIVGFKKEINEFHGIID